MNGERKLRFTGYIRFAPELFLAPRSTLALRYILTQRFILRLERKIKDVPRMIKKMKNKGCRET